MKNLQGKLMRITRNSTNFSDQKFVMNNKEIFTNSKKSFENSSIFKSKVDENNMIMKKLSDGKDLKIFQLILQNNQQMNENLLNNKRKGVKYKLSKKKIYIYN